MGREGEGVGREEQDETRQGRAELKCGGKPFFVVSVSRLRGIRVSASPCVSSFLMIMNSDVCVCASVCVPHTSVQACSHTLTETMYESNMK